MFHDANQQALRQMYVDAWHKHQQHINLTALEQQIVTVILEHPEYQQVVTAPDKYLDKIYHASQGETNPFLHMGLHLGLREQLATNRPAGIVAVYQRLCQTLSAHDAEHEMMTCLAETLYQAQRHHQQMSDEAYLTALQQLVL